MAVDRAEANTRGPRAVQRRVPLISFRDGLSFDPATGDVRRGGHVCRLEPQPAALLALLASRPGTLVGHDEIARHLWPAGTHVAFRDGVHYAVRQIRLACGDTARPPRLIETMPRRGYRLRAGALAAPLGAPPSMPSDGRAASPSSSWRRRAWLAGAAAALAAAIVVVERRPNDHHARAVAVLSALHDWIY